jgi:hypothetical protein
MRIEVAPPARDVDSLRSVLSDKENVIQRYIFIYLILKLRGINKDGTFG